VLDVKAGIAKAAGPSRLSAEVHHVWRQDNGVVVGLAGAIARILPEIGMGVGRADGCFRHHLLPHQHHPDVVDHHVPGSIPLKMPFRMRRVKR
jgi:hypothetical protein